MERRHTFTVFRPGAGPGRGATALELTGLSVEQVEQLRRQVEPGLGAGFAAAVDGEIVARAPIDPKVTAGAAPHELAGALFEEVARRTHQLTEMAVQQHEYCCAELQRMRREYEEEFAQERAILRTLRQRWLERILDDNVHGEDALRYLFGAVRAAASNDQSNAK